MQRLPSSGRIQTKFKVNHPGDVYEQEADRVAGHIMNVQTPQSITKNKCSDYGKINCKSKTCEEDKESNKINVSRRGNSSCNEFDVSNSVTRDISNSINQRGSPLDFSTRQYMESRFGYDFSRVRVHINERSARSADAINALAYTVGNHIVFSHNRYTPGSLDGRKLIAHELVHTIQQDKSSNIPNPQRVAILAPIVLGGAVLAAAAEILLILALAAAAALLAHKVFVSMMSRLTDAVNTISEELEKAISKNPGRCQEEVAKFREARDEALSQLTNPHNNNPLGAARVFKVFGAFQIAANALLMCLGIDPIF